MGREEEPPLDRRRLRQLQPVELGAGGLPVAV
jgi:hypothetical protein